MGEKWRSALPSILSVALALVVCWIAITITRNASTASEAYVQMLYGGLGQWPRFLDSGDGALIARPRGAKRRENGAAAWSLRGRAPGARSAVDDTSYPGRCAVELGEHGWAVEDASCPRRCAVELGEHGPEVEERDPRERERAARHHDGVVCRTHRVDRPRREVDLHLGRVGRAREQIPRRLPELLRTGEQRPVGREHDSRAHVRRQLVEVVERQRRREGRRHPCRAE